MTHTISVIVNIVACVFFISYLGLFGAAYANALSGFILFALNTYWGQKYYKTIMSFWKSMMGIFFILAILIFPSMCYNIIHIAIFVVIINVLTFLTYRKETKIIGTFIKQKYKRNIIWK